MKLADLIKVSLDELRMQMLGVQVLFGFQFQGLFQQGFTDVSPIGRTVDACGLTLLIIVLGCLLAVPSQHRLVDKNKETLRLQRTATRFADVALLPFSVAIGCAVYVAVGRGFDAPTGAILALAASLMALALWYGLGAALRWGAARHHTEVEMSKSETPLHVRIDHMLIEARVVLPGAQALLGFQLIVMMTPAFDHLPRVVQLVHLVALANILTAVVLLIAPAALHRVAFSGMDDPRAYSFGSALLTISLLPLALGVCCDFYVAMTRLLDTESWARFDAVSIFIVLISLWYIAPLFLRRSQHRRRH
jgi:Family of unknown function (DUF6328)